MIPMLALALGGGALAATLVVQRRPLTLLDKLSAQGQGTADVKAKASSLEAPGIILARLSHLDERYQTLIATHLDPWLAGQLRDQQMQDLSHGEPREITPVEKRLNRSLGLGSGGLILIVLSRLTAWPLTPAVILIAIYNSWPVLIESWHIAVVERRFSIIHLMLLYVGSLWLNGYYLVGSLGIILGSVGRKLSFLTQTIARHNLTHILGEQPALVWVIKDGEEIQIPFEQIQLGDLLVLTGGQSVPVDGLVVQGAASVDQHRLTGESQPVEKTTGDMVLAATLVLGGNIRVKVEKTGAETAAAQIGEVLNRTVEYQETRLADLLKDAEKERWPLLAGGALGWIVRGPATGMAMLGCNFMVYQIGFRLLTLLNGLGTGAERGILIKDGRALERLLAVDTVVFDKTGTLTLELQQVVQVHCCPAHAEAEVLAFAAAAEQRQTHPIAQAILAAAAEQQLLLPVLEEAHYELGLGLKVQIQGQQVRIGSERFLEIENLVLPPELHDTQHLAHVEGHALVFVAVADAVVGAIELAAALRPEAQLTVSWLRRQGLMLQILSGDQEAPTAKLATMLGMDGYFANTLPDQKAECIRELQDLGRKVCFIGDGINDAIALRQADVSISLRGATTVATDAAQVVLMDADLSQLRILWELSQGFEDSLSVNGRQARWLSLLASAAVLTLPFGYLTTELLFSVEIIAAMAIAGRPLLKEDGAAGANDLDESEVSFAASFAEAKLAAN